jgi:hypothetical protein
MERGMSLSNYLEELDPSHDYGAGDPMGGLDAFERQLMLAGIRTQSDPSKRIFADPVERFYASDQPASPVLFPEFINRQMRTPLIASSILDEMVAITTPVDTDTYRSIYLTDGVNDRRMRRVTEGSELPTVKLTTSEHPITLHKYGVKLQGTYEAFRRMRIDLFSLHLARIALQSQIDKASEGLDVLINGDGNANGATNYNLTTLDSGTVAGTLTYKAWLRWGLKLFPYQLNTVVAGEAELLSILTLQFPNVNPLMLLSCSHRAILCRRTWKSRRASGRPFVWSSWHRSVERPGRLQPPERPGDGHRDRRDLDRDGPPDRQADERDHPVGSRGVRRALPAGRDHAHPERLSVLSGGFVLLLCLYHRGPCARLLLWCMIYLLQYKAGR